MSPAIPPTESASLRVDGPDDCTASCSMALSIEDLNRGCFCLSVDPQAVHAQLDAILAADGVPASMMTSHPNLFSALPFYVSRHHLEQVAKLVNAIEAVSATPAFQTAVMTWAPPIARFDPGSPGGLLGFDVHLGADGPRLIEINTNPGGALLNAMLGHAQRMCMPQLTASPTDASRVEDQVLDVMLTEWRLQRGGDAPLRVVAIVDTAPEEQYLYPEFVLYRELFRTHGYESEICSPADLVYRDQRLWLNGSAVDFVYNRMTDFSFEYPTSEPLRTAYLNNAVVVSPHPRAHAMYADKRNLSLLCDRNFLLTTGLDQPTVDILLSAVPTTIQVTPTNRDAMWERRRQLFFKPAAGYGSKASYRGDKVTHRVWDQIRQGEYVAQEIVRPSERHVATKSNPLKVDLRSYAYRGEVLLYAARMYQGQTTNFRTPRGGFAPVLTAKHVL